MNDFNWDDLKFFLALYRHKRLSLAAHHLNTARATVSNRISSLESEIGIKLFTQNLEGFHLTPAGAVFLETAKSIEESLSPCRLSDVLKTENTPEIKIGVNEGISDNFIAKELAKFSLSKRFNIKLVTLSKNTNVTTKEVDISITIQKPKSEGVITKLLTSYSLGIYASKEMAIKIPKGLTKQDLKELPWVGYIEEMAYSEALMYHKELPNEVNFIFQSTSLTAQLQATKSGLGLCILPSYIGDNSSELSRIVEEINFTRSYWISTRPDIIASQRHKEIWNYIIFKTQENYDFFLSESI